MKRINIVTFFSITPFLILLQIGQVFAQDTAPLEYQVIREIKLPSPPKAVSHSLDGKLAFF